MKDLYDENLEILKKYSEEGNSWKEFSCHNILKMDVFTKNSLQA